MVNGTPSSPGRSSTCGPRVGELETIGPDPHFSCPQLPSAALSTSSNGMVVFWLAPCTTARTSAQRDAVPVYRVRRRGEHKPLVGFSLGPRNPCGGTAVECLRNGQSAARQRLRVRKLAAPGAAARQTNSCSLRAVRVSGGIRWHGLGFQVVTRCSLAVGVGCVELGLGPARDAILSHQREMAITTLFWAYLNGGSSSQYAIDTQYRGRRDR